jgi:hypothetical protein
MWVLSAELCESQLNKPGLSSASAAEAIGRQLPYFFF